MQSYKLFRCPRCESRFRVIWPESLPSHYHPCSKIRLKCPDCGEMTELHDFLIDRIMQPPDASVPTVEVLSISPRDPNPDPDARMNYWRAIWTRRAARFKGMYGNRLEASRGAHEPATVRLFIDLWDQKK